MPGPDPSEAEAPAEPILEPPEPEQVEPETEQLPEDAPRKLKGRPRKGQVVLPSEGGFLDEVSRISNWDDNQIWVYRIEPNTDRLAQGKAKFIKIWKEALNEEVLMHIYGSGVYSLLWKQRRSPESPLTPYRKLERLEIENFAYPPQIEPGDWIDTRDNARWRWAKKFYDAAAKKEADKSAPPSPTMNLQDIVTAIDVAVDRKLGNAPKDESIIGAFNAGLSAIKAIAPQGDNSGTNTILTILQQQNQAANERADKFMTMLLTDRQKPAEEKDPIAVVAESMKRLDEIRPPRGSRAPDPDHPGWGILDSFVKGISPGLNALIGVAAAKLQQQPATGQQPQPRPAHQQPAATPAPAVANRPITEQPAQPNPEVPIVAVPNVLAQHFQMALNKCLEGQRPDDFAAWLDEGYPTALQELRAIGSEDPPMPWSASQQPADKPWGPVEAIMDIARHQPVWTMIANIPNAEARLTAFIKGVLEWTPEPDDNEAVDPDEVLQ